MKSFGGKWAKVAKQRKMAEWAKIDAGTTQWEKAPELLADEISNFEELLAALEWSSCLWAQLQDTGRATRWSIPQIEAHPCHKLKLP